MKTYWGSRGIAPWILDLGTRWRRVVSFTTQPLYSQGKSPWYPLDRRLGGPQSRSGCCGEEKNSQPPPGIEPRCSSQQPVSIPTELPGLSLLQAYKRSFYESTVHSKSRGSSSRIDRLLAGRPVFNSRQGQWWDFLLFATASRPTAGHTRPPIQWAPGPHTPGVWTWPFASF
jgi:hypothetical protein